MKRPRTILPNSGTARKLARQAVAIRAATALQQREVEQRIGARQTVPWEDLEFITFALAGLVLGCSQGKLYQLCAAGILERLHNPHTGKSLLRTVQVKAVLAATVPTPPGSRLRGRARSAAVAQEQLNALGVASPDSEA